MKIPRTLATNIQRKLCLMVYDCSYADGFTTGLCENNDHRVSWQMAVDTLHRLISCGLIWIPEAKDPGLHENEAVNIGYIRDLAMNDPFSGDMDAHEVWCQWDLCLTDRALEIIARNGLFDADYGERMAPLWRLEAEKIKGENSFIKEAYNKKSTDLCKWSSISRASGWTAGRSFDALVPEFIDSMENIFSGFGLDWDGQPLLVVGTAAGSQRGGQ